MNSDDFFAAADSESIASELMSKVDEWHKLIKTSAIFGKMKKSYRTYYGLSRSGRNSTSGIGTAGDRDELALFRINHYRSLIQNILVMTTQNRPAMQCRSSNTDEISQAQAIIGNGILDYYVREKKLEQFLRTATEMALIYAEGFIGLEWDPNSGNVYGIDPETGKPQYEGDIVYTNYTPLDIVRDCHAKSAQAERWRILIDYQNKYDLAEKYPEFRDEILALEDDRITNLRNEFYQQTQQEDSELIPVYKFYYEKCDSLPQGRRVEFLSDKIKLLDTPLPYKRVPLCRIAPAEQIDTPFGYSVGFDLLGIQDAYDTLNSVVFTNQKTFGVQNILVPEAHNLNPTQLFGGLNLLKYNAKNGEIKPLQLTSTAPEVFNYITSLRGEMEAISGINSVVRGNPGQNIKSGSFAALVAAQAIQFNSGLQNSYNQLLEEVGMQTIEMLQTFAQTKRVVTIVGKNNSSYEDDFSAEDLSNITRVVVDAANPLLKTTEGKLEMANQLLQSGKLEDGDQYIMVATTGKLEPIYEGKQKELMLIRDENEKLEEGQQVQAVKTDKHALHIEEHKVVLSDTMRRQNPQIVQAVVDHIQQHISILADPNQAQLLMVLGQQPLPPMAPPMPQAMPAGAPPQGAQMQAQKQIPALTSVQNPPEGTQPNMPNMPTNPLTGNKYNQATGGN